MLNKLIKKILAIIGYRLEPIYPKLDSTDHQRLAHVYNNYKPLRVHLGCGPRILKGWVNIDLSYQLEGASSGIKDGEYRSSELMGARNDFYALNIVSTGLPLPDNCVDAVFHEDFIEHLNQRDQIILLAEILRVLKPGCVHRVNTPNLLKTMQEHSNFKQGGRGVYAAEWNDHLHLNILTADSLKELAQTVGYSQIIFNGKDQSISPFMPPEYRPAGDRPPDGNIFADLVK